LWKITTALLSCQLKVLKATHVEWPDITSAAFVGAVMSDNGSETAVEKGVAMSAMDLRIVNKANCNI
jgi:hypothetical protein